jgi:hypothetical protein
MQSGLAALRQAKLRHKGRKDTKKQELARVPAKKFAYAGLPTAHVKLTTLGPTPPFITDPVAKINFYLQTFRQIVVVLRPHHSF